MENNSHLYGAIEGGGTKFICAVGSGANHTRAETRFPTTTPQETMTQAVSFFKQQESNLGKLSAIGFACFGPLGPNPVSPTYGHILPTPKPGWTNTDVIGMLKKAFDIPIAFDTEVNGAALAGYSFMLSPQRIIFGGGVGSLLHLLPKVQKKTRELINGYIQSPVILENIESYIIPPGPGNRSDMLGAIALAEQALQPL